MGESVVAYWWIAASAVHGVPFRWQLAARVCVALLLGWHVYGLLLPFLVFGVATEAAAAFRRGAGEHLAGRIRATAACVVRGPSVLLGGLALLFGLSVLGYNFAREHAVCSGQRAVMDLPSSCVHVAAHGASGGAAGAGVHGAAARRPAAPPSPARCRRCCRSSCTTATRRGARPPRCAISSPCRRRCWRRASHRAPADPETHQRGQHPFDHSIDVRPR